MDYEEASEMPYIRVEQRTSAPTNALPVIILCLMILLGCIMWYLLMDGQYDINTISPTDDAQPNTSDPNRAFKHVMPPYQITEVETGLNLNIST